MHLLRMNSDFRVVTISSGPLGDMILISYRRPETTARSTLSTNGLPGQKSDASAQASSSENPCNQNKTKIKKIVLLDLHMSPVRGEEQFFEKDWRFLL